MKGGVTAAFFRYIKEENMDKNRFYTREKEINGTKYVAQFNGLSSALRAIDESHIDNNSSNVSILKISKYVFSNVIVEPAGLTADDFDSVEELNEVVRFGMEVMQGKFRNTDENTTSEISE